MATTSLLIGATLAAGAGALNAQTGPESADVVGSWAGTLDAMGRELRLVFNIDTSESGELVGTLDSPDEGLAGMALSAVEVACWVVKGRIAS